MKFGVQSCRRQRKKFLVATLGLTLAVLGVAGLGGRIWASGTDMTRVWFSNALFCQRVSQAINDSLGNGMADGSDCVNFNLYVSSDAIESIQTLNITSPEGGFGSIDLESQSISINGDWTTVFRNLTSLSITDMYVQDITPLGGLAGDLTYLDLSNNRIYDITPLRRMKGSLEYLDLSGNRIGMGIRELSRFTELTTLKLVNTGVYGFDEMFRPPDVEIVYDEVTGELEGIVDVDTREELTGASINPATGELLGMPDSSELARVLRILDIGDNENMSGEKEASSRTCDGSLSAFETYANDLVMTELYANSDNLNVDDLMCVAALKHLEKLDVSNNHIDNFASIKNKTYASLKADTQTFTRTIESLDYDSLPEIFTQAGQENYFVGVTDAHNSAVALGDMELDNARFNGTKVRFVNAAIAVAGDDSQPATVLIPEGSGVFENSKLQVYFAGQVVTFNDANLCNMVYSQGATGEAFVDMYGNSSWSPDNPVVLTNACDASKKQIAMVSGGSSYYLQLRLDDVNNGAVVDLTGLEEFGGLEVLSLKNDGLTDLGKLVNMYQVKQLWLDDNNLESDDWAVITGNLTSLEILYLNNNHMSEISAAVANLNNLGNLYLVNNGISDVSPLANIPSLTVLDLSKNEGITDFSGMAGSDSSCNPSILKLEDAGVVRLPDASVMAEGFSNLTSLNLNGNRITDETIANLAGAPRLEELYLKDNQISSTSGFSEMTRLRKLFLDNNQISDVSGLSTLVRLAELHLKNNRIGDVDGLNTLPVLATLDLKEQSLTGTVVEAEEAYALPMVFSQAKVLDFANVSGFQSTGAYDVTNGVVDYEGMTATMEDVSEPMTITIPDGGLAGTKVTVTYAGSDDVEFGGTLTDNTNGGAVITVTSPNGFSVTSDKACMVLWTQDDGAVWNRLGSSMVAENNEMREFGLEQANGVRVVVAYAGDVDGNGVANAIDARKIVSARMGIGDALSDLGRMLADVDNNGVANAIDARKIVSARMGSGAIDW